MRINEIFYSLQGEGSFTGTPAVFIRFSGCNTKCPFCDTQHEEYVEMTEDEILAEVKKYPANHVVITGGEPTLQLTPSLCQKLQENLFFVQIETNGSVKLDSKFNLKDQEESLIDWVTCSPKNLPIKIQRIDELKVTAERIRQLENILTDIDLIGDNAEKGITLTVPSISGSQTDYTFISSQADTSGFKTATRAECNRLKQQLQQQIRALQAVESLER